MDLSLEWERHLLSAWHPGILVAVLVAAFVAWHIGAATTRLVLRVRDPWRRIVYLSVPVLVIATFVQFLPGILFFIGWKLTHAPHVHADLYTARRLLWLPLGVAVVSAARKVLQHRRPSPEETESVG